MSAAPDGRSAVIAVTAAYWAFMLTDGALRMLALLHFHENGFTPVQLASLFALYEAAGMAANLSAGWIAARFGLLPTLCAGLAIQVAALLALAQLDPAWSVGLSVVFVMCVQGASGVAKDLTKTSSKSAIRLLAPDAKDGLFRWVAALTGSKNAVKGLGFLLGAALLASAGFAAATLGMAMALAAVLAAVVVFTPPGLPGGSAGARFSEVLSRSRKVNRLSAARVFLFAARDVWFVVGIPIHFHAVVVDGGGGSRFAFLAVGTFMALWIMLYGAVQAATPGILRASEQPEAALADAAARWAWRLAIIPAALAAAALGAPDPWLTVALVAGLMAFCPVFAVNSSLHSYLILAFAKADRVSMDVGFYYMANAGGRLLGTLLSGLAYQTGGLALTLAMAAAMAGAAALAAGRLRM